MRIPSIPRRLPAQGEAIHVRLRSANLDECTGLLLSRQADIAIVFRQSDEPNDFNDDFLEIKTIGTDRLLPVFSTDLAGLGDREVEHRDLPCIAYPADVFFGKVMERKILPFLPLGLHPTPRVETALTLAALEMAAAGIGVAWVPESLVLDHLAKGRLTDLSEALPSCDLQIQAMRLQGTPSQAGVVFWSQLTPQ